MNAPVEKRINTMPTRQLLARAGEFEARLLKIEHDQPVMTWLMAEFLHNWRMSIAAAYAARRVDHGQTG